MTSIMTLSVDEWNEHAQRVQALERDRVHHEQLAAQYQTALRNLGDATLQVRRLERALAQINAIRNSIIAAQKVNFSEHVYPLVAALNEAGFAGMAYPDALAYYGTMLERTNAAETKVTALERAHKQARGIIGSLLNHLLRYHNDARCPVVREAQQFLEGIPPFEPEDAALRAENERLRAALVRLLVATTFDEAYTDDLVAARTAAAPLVGLPAPPHWTTSAQETERWVAQAVSLGAESAQESQ